MLFTCFLVKLQNKNINPNEAEAEDNTLFHFRYTYPCHLRIGETKAEYFYLHLEQFWLIYNTYGQCTKRNAQVLRCKL